MPSSWPTLSQLWATKGVDFGPTALRLWADLSQTQTLNQPLADLGPTLGLLWVDFGSTLGWIGGLLQADFGSTSDRLWTDSGSILGIPHLPGHSVLSGVFVLHLLEPTWAQL